jgi:hypothetical protein
MNPVIPFQNLILVIEYGTSFGTDFGDVIVDWSSVPFWADVAKECPWVDFHNLDRMSNGDTDAAESFIFHLPNPDRGRLVAWVFTVPGYSQAIKQTVLATAWEHDHLHVAQAAGSMRRLLSWFKKARFPKSHLPERFPVWRGTSYQSLTDARKGLSWSVDKDTACWFALRRVPEAKKSTALVLRRDITRDEVLFHREERQENEIVLAPGGGVVDGDLTEWLRLARIYSQRSTLDTAVTVGSA